ncbi:polysaccharide biosynthesis/export family protein [Coraliomargarita parva]|uniref:polysaccharide biosynthesis/export family protein n=1 Tax=Coraliomargarita parva TaxID=3014050 RepID=UPI0022B4E902|nr:SLBB domain-containing protein [Coraliomargarita parva]
MILKLLWKTSCLGLLLAGMLPHLSAQAGVASTEAPTRMALLDDEWKLQIGDRLIYQVMEEREEPLLLAVNGNGDLLLPLVGSFKAEGKTSKALAYEIKTALEKDFFHRATVLIIQREEDRNRGRVTVIGEVNKQGEQLIPVDSPLTLSQAILQSGGFTIVADRSKVSVVSEGQQEPRIEVDVGAMMDGGDFSKDPMLKAGDVVIIGRSNQADRQVYILGAVQAPGLLTIRDDAVTISQAILKAGGFTRFAKRNRVRLITKDDAGAKTELEIDVGKILEGGDRSADRPLKPGDMVIVEEKMISFGG